MCALRFFYGEVLDQPDVVERIRYARRERRLPVVLSVDETIELLRSIEHPRYRVLLTTIYATGLRLSEALALRAADIDSKRKAVEADLAAKVAAAETSIRATKTEALGHVTEIATDTVQALVTQLTGSATADEARKAVAAAAKE